MRIKDLYELLDYLMYTDDPGIGDREVNVLIPDSCIGGYEERWVSDYEYDADMNLLLICK